MTTEQPIIQIEIKGCQLTLLGTAHVSRASAEKVEELLNTETFDAVAIELCPSRYRAISNPDGIADMDLFQVMREGKAPTMIASLALGAFQQRIAEQFDIEPGAEMRMAIKSAEQHKLPVALVDRDIGITLKRI